MSRLSRILCKFNAPLAIAMAIAPGCARPSSETGSIGLQIAQQAPTAAPLAELDASGELKNRIIWPAATAAQQPIRRSFLTFTAPADGAFYVTKLLVTPVGCDVRQLGMRLFAGQLTGDGRLDSWTRIDPFDVIRMVVTQRLLLAVEGNQGAVCGDIESLLAARFLATLKSEHAPSIGEQPAGPAPLPRPQPELPLEPEHPAVPTPAPLPEPQPAPQPSPPVSTSCAADPAGPADPAILRATIKLYGQLAGADHCEASLTWRLSDYVKRDPHQQCQFPQVRISEGTGSPLLMLQTFFGSVLLKNLAWLQLPSNAERDAVKQGLLLGQTIDLVADVPPGRPQSERCRVPGNTHAPWLQNDLFLTLFQGDPRDACLSGSGSFTFFEFSDPLADFRIDRGDQQFSVQWTWPSSLPLPSASVRLRLFNRRLLAFMSNSAVPAKNVGKVFTAVFTGPDAALAMASEGDLELVLNEEDLGQNAALCRRVLVLPYARYFLDPAYSAAFHGSFSAGN